MTRLAFLYLGRRGALSRFTFDAISAADEIPGIEASVVVSRHNERAELFASLGDRALLVETFATNVGALLGAWRLPLLQRRLAVELRRRRVEAVIELMPHVWSPVLAGTLRSAGSRYMTVVHDAEPHPGDATARLHRWLLVAATRADHVLTLSCTVAAHLVDQGHVTPDRVTALFHPDLSYDEPTGPVSVGGPLRLLFLGRILPYKGLSLFVDAIEELTATRVPVQAGVFGEGDLGAAAPRLRALGAEVVNRWLDEDEIAAILARYDVLVASHVEASQSGVVATAFGAGLPVIATPVGGLVEQVENGVTGCLLPTVSAGALASAVSRLASDADLLDTLRAGVARRREGRSMRRFVERCAAVATNGFARCAD